MFFQGGGIMSKLTPIILSMVFMIGGMALASKFISKTGLDKKEEIVKRFGAAMSKQDDVLNQVLGRKANAPAQDPMKQFASMSKMNSTEGVPDAASLLAGGTSTVEETPQKPNSPKGPVTVINYMGEKNGKKKTWGTQVMKLPPGAEATFVDGRLQIFYPHGKPKPNSKPKAKQGS
jgi:hypothetical protein